MARDRHKSPALEESDRDNEIQAPSKREHNSKSNKRVYESDSDSESDSDRGSKRSIERKRKSKKTRKYSDDSDDDDSSESEYSSESEGERRRRKRRERKRREEKEREKKRRKREKDKKKKKEEKKAKGKMKGAVTNSWGKYGIIRETDMWNKRPEFTAWLQEVKQMNLESLPNWEEKQMFKDFMEDHNTATFPSKKYYNLDAYYKHKLEKETKKGMKKIGLTEMTVFNDEEIRRQEMQQVRERQKAEEVEALKRSMQSGMAQAMKEQAQLREEMLYQYKVGNLEAAAAIQRRLDPDVAM